MARPYGEYGQCEATAKTTGEQCGQPAEGPHGKCRFHGGASLKGEESPTFKHGIYSDVVRPEDREVLDALEDLSTAKKLDETLNLQLMKLRRAVALLDDPDREVSFWTQFEALVQNIEDPQPGQIQELAQLLDTPHRAQRDLMDLIRKTAKTLHDITEGQDINVSHDVDTEAIEELKGLAEDAYE